MRNWRALRGGNGGGGGGGRGGVGGDEGAYMVEGDLFQCFWSFLHPEMQRLQDSEHASNIVFPKVESVCVEVDENFT